MKNSITRTVLSLILAFSMSITLSAQSTNIAKGKTAKQSTTAYNQIGAASNAVDGNTNGMWSHNNNNSITHTSEDNNPWWEVDLGAVYDISKIKIWNRADACCWNRLQNFHVMVSESPISANSTTENQFISGAHSFTAADQTSLILEGNIKGRYVRIFLPGNKKVLSLTEVEVFGSQSTSATMGQGDQLPLTAGMEMKMGKKYNSPSGKHQLILGEDGNLVVIHSNGGFHWGSYQTGQPLWGKKAKLNADGEFCVYDAQNRVLWSTYTKTPNSKLSVNDKGEVEIIAPNKQVLWNGSHEAVQPQLFPFGSEGRRKNHEIGTGKDIKLEVIFVDFSDQKSNPINFDQYWNTITSGNKLTEAFKVQGATVTANVHKQWKRMPKKLSHYFPTNTGDKHWDWEGYTKDAIKLLGQGANYSPNTICIVLTDKNKAGFKSIPSGAHGAGGFRGIRRMVTLMPKVYEDDYTVLMHEIGHTFGSGELYPANQPYQHEIAGYDAMGACGNSTGFMGWHRYRYGWMGKERLQFLHKKGDYQIPLKKLSRPNGKAMVVIPDPNKVMKSWVIEIGQTVVSWPNGANYNNEGDRIIVYTVEHPEVKGKRAIRMMPRESFTLSHNTQEWVDKASYPVGESFDKSELPFSFSTSNKTSDGCILNVRIKKDIMFATFPDDIQSDNKEYNLTCNSDGNLVVQGNGRGWDAKTKLFNGLPVANTWVALRNGNIQLIDAHTGQALGEKRVGAPTGASFKASDDGKLLVVDSGGKEVWRNQ